MLKRKTIIILSSLTLAIIIIASLIFTLSSNQTIDSNTSLDDFKDKDLITNEQWINALTEATGYEWFDNLKTLDYATKDFIAQTSIQATGFIADTIIQFADAHLIEDVNSAGLSVQVNILDMKRGNNFVPHENMTIADSKKSINRIKEIVAVPEIDPNHEDEIIYHKNVIDLSHLNTNNVTINDSEGKSISFKKADISNLKVGDIYIVPPSDIFPNSAAFKVSSISENDDIVTVANTEADISEVLSRIDIQGVYYPDFDNVITYAGIEDIGDSRSLYAQIDDIDWKEGIVHFRDDYIDEGHIEFGIEISDGSASISGMVKLLPRITAVYDVEYDVNWFRKNEWSVNELYFLLELDSEISVDFTGKIEKAIPIANFPFPICAGVSINLVVELVPSLEGGLSIRLSNYDSVGYKLVNGSLCRIENGNNSGISLDASLSLKLEIPFNAGLAFNVLNFPLIHGGVTLGIGAMVSVDLLTTCLDANLYGILRLFLNIDLFIIKYEDYFAVFDHDTDKGFKLKGHMEDFEWVNPCTRKNVQEEVLEISNSDYTWKEHYIHYIQEVHNYNDARYQLIYITDDDIPELLSCHNYADDGFDIYIMSYVDTYQSGFNTTAMSFSYIEHEYLLHTYNHGYNSDGSRYRYDYISEILINQIPYSVNLLSGGCSFDAQGNFTYGSVNNVEVSSYEEYERLLDSVFDFSKAISFEDIEMLDYQEIIKMIENY